jgi:hypothetical protein
MRWNEGRRAFDRRAKREPSEEVPYSRPVFSQETPKLIVVGWLSTPSRRSRRTKFG